MIQANLPFGSLSSRFRTFTPFCFDPRQKRVHIVDREVHHEGLRRRREIIGVFGERTPHHHRRMAGRVVAQRCPAPILDRDAQHVAIPRRQRLRVLALEEDAAHAGDASGSGAGSALPVVGIAIIATTRDRQCRNPARIAASRFGAV